MRAGGCCWVGRRGIRRFSADLEGLWVGAGGRPGGGCGVGAQRGQAVAPQNSMAGAGGDDAAAAAAAG